MNAAEILKIQNPKVLFGNDLEKNYRQLCKIWHPDANGGIDDSIFLHINSLYNEAKQLIASGLWDLPENARAFKLDSGKKMIIYPQKTNVLDFGEMFICKNNVIYFVKTEFKILVANAIDKLNSLKFVNAAMRQEFDSRLSKITKAENCENGLLVVTTYDPETILLADAFNHWDHKVNFRTIAWVISSLYDLACFLQYNEIVHHDISLENCFICPEKHYVVLTSFWFASNFDAPILALPKRTLELTRVNPKVTQNFIDLELIRRLGLELSGNQTLPNPLHLWFNSVSSQNAITEYQQWDQVIIDTWGKKEFFNDPIPKPFY
jgi:serine/threonine protein kinase